MTVLNTIMADSMDYIANEIEARMSKGLEAAVNEVIVAVFKKHNRIIFNGNGYSEEWHQEAEKRGLANVPNAVDALAALGLPKNIDLFSRWHVLSPAETESRMNIQFEAYAKAIAIEGQSALSIARTMILPAAQKTQRDVADSLSSAKMHGLTVDKQTARLRDMSLRLEDFITCLDELATTFERAESHVGSDSDHAKQYRDYVVPAMEKLREQADLLETMTDDAYWPLPKYRELLFLQ
jgi:glutamine synthetase